MNIEILSIQGARALLGALLVAAVWSDVSSRRIPNAVTVAGLALALAWHAVAPDGAGLFAPAPLDVGGLGVVSSLAGAVVCLAALLPFYAIRVLGAGDVKLMAMLGAVFGLAALPGLAVTVAAALAVVVACRLAVNGSRRRVLTNLGTVLGGIALRTGGSFDLRGATPDRVPMAVPLALGAAALATLQTLGLR
jgi:prepilin peptidase CpaA